MVAERTGGGVGVDSAGEVGGGAGDGVDRVDGGGGREEVSGGDRGVGFGRSFYFAVGFSFDPSIKGVFGADPEEICGTRLQFGVVVFDDGDPAARRWGMWGRHFEGAPVGIVGRDFNLGWCKLMARVIDVDRTGDVSGGVRPPCNRVDGDDREFGRNGGEGAGSLFGIDAAAVHCGEAKVVGRSRFEAAKFCADFPFAFAIYVGRGNRVLGTGGRGRPLEARQAVDFVFGELLIGDVFKAAFDVEGGIGARGPLHLAGDFGRVLAGLSDVIGGEDGRFGDFGFGSEGAESFFGDDAGGGVFGGQTQVVGGAGAKVGEGGANGLFAFWVDARISDWILGAVDRDRAREKRFGVGFVFRELLVGEVFEVAADVEGRIRVGGAFDFAGCRGGGGEDRGGSDGAGGRRRLDGKGGEGGVGRRRGGGCFAIAKAFDDQADEVFGAAFWDEQIPCDGFVCRLVTVGFAEPRVPVGAIGRVLEGEGATEDSGGGDFAGDMGGAVGDIGDGSHFCGRGGCGGGGREEGDHGDGEETEKLGRGRATG
jgi:hypothetical protein